MTRLEQLSQSVLLLGVPLAFGAIALAIMPIGEVLQFDPDEGIELAKVMLYNQGYQLYDQIWNDQPPLLTLLLGAWLKHFGSQIVAARLLILSFAMVLVGSFHGLLRLSRGAATALLGTIALTLTFGFLRLSVSVMRGLPALALAVLAIYLLCWATEASSHSKDQRLGDRRQHWGLLASGLCFGLALQIKLYVLMLAPACTLHLLLGARVQDWIKPAPFQRLPSVLLWSISWAGAAVFVGLLSPSWDVQQLLGTHFDDTTQTALQREPSWLLLLMFLAQDLDYSLLAGLSLWTLGRYRPPWPLLPVVWLGTVLLVLSFHQPLWDHYYPLIAVPVVWLATYSLPQAANLWRPRQWLHPLRRTRPLRSTLKGWVTGCVILAIALLPLKLALVGIFNTALVENSRAQAPVIAMVRAFAPQTRWLFTDLPIAAFYAQLKVPPELTVFSTKRLKTGDLSTANLLRILKAYQPEQVLLGRYPQIEADLTPYLQQHYVKHFTKDQITQYLLKSLA